MTSNFIEQETRFPRHRKAVEMVTAERNAQFRKWGHDPGRVEEPHGNNDRRLRVLVEEVGEIAMALNDGDPIHHLLDEVVQAAAVATAWAEGLLAEIDQAKNRVES
jgi:hypothetical protein